MRYLKNRELIKYQQDNQHTCKHNIEVHLVTNVAVEKQQLLHILSVCLLSLLPSIQCACVVLYCYYLPVWLTIFFHIIS